MAWTGKQVRQSVDRLVEGAVHRLKTRGAAITNSAAFAKGVDLGLGGILGWLFSSAVIFGRYAPFGLGFMATAGAGAPGGTARARWHSLVFSCVVWVNNGISIPSSEYGICQSSPGPVPGAVPAV